jgi:hypothetical protein
MHIPSLPAAHEDEDVAGSHLIASGAREVERGGGARTGPKRDDEDAEGLRSAQRGGERRREARPSPSRGE